MLGLYHRRSMFLTQDPPSVTYEVIDPAEILKVHNHHHRKPYDLLIIHKKHFI